MLSKPWADSIPGGVGSPAWYRGTQIGSNTSPLVVAGKLLLFLLLHESPPSATGRLGLPFSKEGGFDVPPSLAPPSADEMLAAEVFDHTGFGGFTEPTPDFFT